MCRRTTEGADPPQGSLMSSQEPKDVLQRGAPSSKNIYRLKRGAQTGYPFLRGHGDTFSPGKRLRSQGYRSCVAYLEGRNDPIE